MKFAPQSVRRNFALAWITAGLAALPLFQYVPFDLDRQASVLIALPPLLALWPESLALATAFLTRRRANALAAAAAVLVVAAATLHSAHRAPALVTAASWCFYAVLALTTAVLTRTEGGRAASRTILAGVASGGVVGTALLATNWFGHADPTNASWIELVTPYAHFRHVGLHLLSASLAAATLVLDSQLRPSGRALAGAAGVAIWTAFLWSGSRAPLFGLGIGILTLCWLSPVRRALAAAALCTALLSAALGLSLLFPSREVVFGWRHASTRTFQVSNVQEASSNRTAIWRISAAHALDAPWLGFGPDGYRFLTPKTDGQQPHNLELQILLDVGVLGLGAVSALLALVLPWQLLRRAPCSADLAAPAAGAAAILLASQATAQFDGVFYHAVSCLPAFIALGLFIAYRPMDDGPSLVHGNWVVRWIASGILASACIIQCLHSIIFSIISSTPPALPANDWPAKLVRAFPSTLIGLPFWLDEWQQKSPDTALEWTAWAQKHAPNAFTYHLRAGIELARRGDLQGAIIQIDAAHETAPASAQPGIADIASALRRAYAASRPAGSTPVQPTTGHD